MLQFETAAYCQIHDEQQNCFCGICFSAFYEKTLEIDMSHIIFIIPCKDIHILIHIYIYIFMYIDGYIYVVISNMFQHSKRLRILPK